MHSLLLIIVLSLSSCLLHGQTTKNLQSRPLRTDSSSIHVHLLNDDTKNPKKINPDCFYHWLKGGEIKQTRGGFDGQLLHGNFTEFYINGQLRQKGQFQKGLKSGEWRSWHQNGELQSITHFKNGHLDGKIHIYNVAGKLSEVKNYRNGVLHGEQIVYSDTTTTKVYFKSGLQSDKIVHKKERNTFKRKKSDVPVKKENKKSQKEGNASPEIPTEGEEKKPSTPPVEINKQMHP